MGLSIHDLKKTSQIMERTAQPRLLDARLFNTPHSLKTKIQSLLFITSIIWWSSVFFGLQAAEIVLAYMQEQEDISLVRDYYDAQMERKYSYVRESIDTKNYHNRFF